MNKNTLSAHHQ